MRRFLCAGAMAALSWVALCLLANRAEADVIVHIDRSSQTMTVVVDGTPRYRWLISTGRPGLGTPGGIFHPHRLARSWFSRRYDNSPMPHSIFFTGGIAIHGSYEVARLGRAVSHGCVRLDPGHAAMLYGLVQREGTDRTTIVVH
ncbi:MAG TPA: L,D-transpeptidase [Xanthobacteraceae bacterium]|jgi:lipoprotein-anchoring transpeptidase ErfK/SrfK